MIRIQYCIDCGHITDVEKDITHCRELVREDEHCEGELRVISVQERDIVSWWMEAHK